MADSTLPPVAPALTADPSLTQHATVNGTFHDVEMKEEPAPETTLNSVSEATSVTQPAQMRIETPIPLPGQQQTSIPLPSQSSAPAPAPTMSQQNNTTPTTTPSQARSSPHPASAMSAVPANPHPHGSPTRVYLNQYVTPHLLEAMKHLVTNEPEKPLKYLSEYLAEKSRELEGL